MSPDVIGTPVAFQTIVVVVLLVVQLKVSGAPILSIWTLKLLFAVPVKVPLDFMSLRLETVPVADV
jgi:hypothetical protein